MRILQVASFYAPTIGGMETMIRDLSEGLVRQGDQVTVLCAAENRQGCTEICGGVKVRRSPSLGKLLSQPLTPLLPLELRQLHRGFDVVHLHMPNPLAEAAAMTLPAGTPIVVTYHADVIRQRALRPVYGPIRDAVLARSRRIVVPTENHIRFSEVLPRLRSKCAVVPFGLAPERYTLNDSSRRFAAELRQRFGPFVLFVGRLVYYKGLPALVESMRTLDFKLVIVGDGPLRPGIQRKIEAVGLGQRVVLIGSVPQETLNGYLEACEVLVLPSVSRAEGFGMTLLEGMLFRKPLVTTHLPSGVDVVNQDGVTGFQVPPGDQVALTDALRRLMEDDALRRSMGARARQRLEDGFSVRRMIEGYRAVYSQAIA